MVESVEWITPTSSFNLSFGFFADGSYQLIVGGDDTGFLCDPGPSCVEMGDFSFSGSVITLDPGTVDALQLQYSVSGGVLAVSGTLDGAPFSASLEET